LKNLYNRLLYNAENIPKIQIFDLGGVIKDLKISDQIDKLKNVSLTPGALRVPDIVIPNVNTTDLTKAGIIKETNRNRVEIGQVPPLIENTKLDMSAQKKIVDMFAKQYFEHISPSGVGVSDLASEVNYEYILVGENLALGNFKNNASLLDAWMNSPGHRANILNKNYTEIGIAVGQGNFEGKQIWLAVQHFGAPRNLCPTIDNILRGLIDLSQKNINEIQKDLLTRKGQIDSGVIVEGSTTNEQIVTYNNIVNTYNKLISDLKNKITEYNSQIKLYNNCVESYK
jgi:uncharacterized protein YkwD